MYIYSYIYMSKKSHKRLQKAAKKQSIMRIKRKRSIKRKSWIFTI